MNVPLIRLGKGDAVILDGVWYQEKLRTASTLTLGQIGGDHARTLTSQELLDLYFAERLKIVRGQMAMLDPATVELISRPLESFSPDQQAEMLKRFDYVTACDRFFARGCYTKRPESGYQRIALIVARYRRLTLARQKGCRTEQIPLEIVSGSALRDWYTRWRKWGRLLGALAPLTDNRGNREKKLHPAVRAAIADFVRGKWLTLEKPSVTVVHQGICAAVTKLGLPEPSEMAVRRWIDENIDPYTRTLYRDGPKKAEHDFRLTKRAPIAVRPLQIVEFDETPLDIILVDPNGKILGRAYLTAGICLATGMIVGWHIGLEKPSWSTVMQALRMAVLKKDLGNCGAESPYPVYGVPEVIKVDNGPAYRSTSLVAAAGQLQFELRLVPRGKPHLKGKVERFFGQVARDFLSVFPGRTFANTLERLDYDSEGNARMTLEQCSRLFMRWVVDIYHNLPNRNSFNHTALERWLALAGYGVRLPPEAADLAPLVGLIVHRTIQAEGITFMGLTYSDDVLKGLRKSSYVGREWIVKIDPLDISHLLVLDDDKKRWLRMPCQQPELVEGLTLKMWMDVVSAARARTKAGQRVSRRILLKAREDLMREAEALGHKPRAKVTAVEYRWMEAELNKPEYEISVDPDGNDDEFSSSARTPKQAASQRRKLASQQDNVADCERAATFTEPASSARGHPIVEPSRVQVDLTVHEQELANELSEFEEQQRLQAFRDESARGGTSTNSSLDHARHKGFSTSPEFSPHSSVGGSPESDQAADHSQTDSRSPPPQGHPSLKGTSSMQGVHRVLIDENDDALYG
ncbi:DDE-type integrase/transposase/recombinase [Bradyrhizobium yuanmingense]|uniref:Mu transposase C-terminal domain-containing protein n=1 Tax=Bradyrhizobium yuanmingense TaxID=108015 RepID=UPI0012F9D812|nr:Mu transposase C-terminal domain-containing protein [Bradyrhizobium yuanmingense]MVT52594.1 DDE-type integrase/transposase/recombinase [Bradyrhizobium yuanmingense]